MVLENMQDSFLLFSLEGLLTGKLFPHITFSIKEQYNIYNILLLIVFE